jgi:hypothetical protein
VGVGIERGPVEFMSNPWQELLGHAFSNADRLGLQIALAGGPGCRGTGGPWVKPEESMQHLVASEVAIEGPATFDAQLPRSLPRIPFFGEATLSPELYEAWEEFYMDVLVVAFPTPAGNARSSNFELFVNGRSVETGNNEKKIQRVDVTSLLTSGNNVLTVTAILSDKENRVSPRLIGALTIKFGDGSSKVINTDHYWNGALTNQEYQTEVKELGAFGASPWRADDTALQERSIYPSYRVVQNVLAHMGLLSDFDGGEGIRYIHRRDGADDIYFIANREDRT